MLRLLTILFMLGCAACSRPRAAATVVESAWLFAAPDNLRSEALVSLEAGATVYPIAVYRDFVRVEYGPSLQGYAPRHVLANLPADLPELDPMEVPWIAHTEDIQDRLTLHPDVAFNADTAAVVFDNSPYDRYNDRTFYIVRPFGGFRLTFQIDYHSDLFSGIKLTDRPHTDAPDSWWKGVRRIDIGAADNCLRLQVWDGAVDRPLTVFSDTLPEMVTVTFHDPQGKVVSVSDQNGAEMVRLDITALANPRLSKGLFPERVVHLGYVIAPHSTLTLRSLSLETAPAGEFTVKEPTLRELGDTVGISFGTEFSWRSMDDPRYFDLLADHYHTLVLSEFSSKTFWRGRGEYDFAALDRIVDWANRRGFRVRGAHLVWGATEGEALPDWLTQTSFSKDEYRQILQEHVTTVAGHFRGRVAEWSIANEAISRSAAPGADFWMDAIGPEYIAWSFRWARAADPSALLIFNDHSNESLHDAETGWIAREMYATVERLKAQGVPIDAVGMQMHLLLNQPYPRPPEKREVIDTMRTFGQLGVAVFITEFDVALNHVAGSQAERWNYQAELYRAMIEACLESGVCSSFATWGVGDATSWITCQEAWCLNLPDADPLMFDRDFNPKPAYYAVHAALVDHAVADDR